MSARRKLPAWRSDFYRPAPVKKAGKEVRLFVDCFSRYFEPENARAARAVLEAGGYTVVEDTSSRPLCCGRTFLSAGLVDQAREEMSRLLDALTGGDAPIVGIEPSCLLTLRDRLADPQAPRRGSSRSVSRQEGSIPTIGAVPARQGIQQARHLLPRLVHQAGAEEGAPAAERRDEVSSTTVGIRPLEHGPRRASVLRLEVPGEAIDEEADFLPGLLHGRGPIEVAAPGGQLASRAHARELLAEDASARTGCAG